MGLRDDDIRICAAGLAGHTHTHFEIELAKLVLRQRSALITARNYIRPRVRGKAGSLPGGASVGETQVLPAIDRVLEEV